MQLRLTLEKRRDVVVSWISRHDTGTRSLVGVTGCLLDIATTERANVAFASLESALFLGKVTHREWRRASALLPQTLRRELEGAGILSESGGESLASFGLRQEGIEFKQQVKIPKVGRVDIVVGRSLVVEIDGARFHTEREQFEEDRRRDAVLSTLDYRVLRFSYTQVADRWGEVLAAVRASISRGDHLDEPSHGEFPARATAARERPK
jgi:very-short-patch-repair endonuclease